MPTDPIEVTLLVTQVLEEMRVRYFIGGSLASTLYGLIRTTQDADIIAEIQVEQIPAFVTALENIFFIDELQITDAIVNWSSFNIIHRETMFKVDVFVPKPRIFHQEQFSRAKKVYLSDEPTAGAYFATAEDTVLAKLEWYRLGGEVSDRQWRDVIGILTVQVDTLDLSYLRSMAKELRIDDLLDRVLRFVGITL